MLDVPSIRAIPALFADVAKLPPSPLAPHTPAEKALEVHTRHSHNSSTPEAKCLISSNPVSILSVPIQTVRKALNALKSA